jgi:hypothetical protein
MAAYTLFDIVYRIARELAVAFEGTATGGSGTTLVDNIYLKDGFIDDYFNKGTLFLIYDAGGAGVAPQGEWARITDFAESTGTITHEALTASIAAGDRYAVANDEYTRDIIIQNLNIFLMETPIPYVDITTITTAEDKTEYTLPAELLDENIKVWIQRTDTTDHNLWTEYSDWYIAETAVGTQKKLIFNSQPPEPWIAKLEYWLPHPALNARTDKLAEHINISRVVLESALKCLLWKRAQKTQAEPILDSRIAEMNGRVMEARSRFPTKKPPEVKLAHYGLTHNFEYGRGIDE